MTRKFIALGAALALLAGCDAATEAGEAEFDREFIQSCNSSATAGGTIPAEVAEAYCDCALTKINEQYSGTDKLGLTPEQAQPIMLQCFSEVQANG
jgi:hypothetical protein